MLAALVLVVLLATPKKQISRVAGWFLVAACLSSLAAGDAFAVIPIDSRRILMKGDE